MGLAATAAGFRLRFGGSVALRLRSRRLSALRSTFPARRPQTEARQSAFAGKVMNSPISDWPISDFPITDCKIASHSACRRNSAMKPPLIVWRRRSRQEVLWSANTNLEKVINMESASAWVSSGACSCSIVWLDCACQGSPKK